MAKNVATMRSQRATGNAYACSVWGVRRLVANLPGNYDFKKTPRTTARKKALTPQNHPHGQNKSNTKYLITMKGITVNPVVWQNEPLHASTYSTLRRGPDIKHSVDLYHTFLPYWTIILFSRPQININNCRRNLNIDDVKCNWTFWS